MLIFSFQLSLALQNTIALFGLISFVVCFFNALYSWMVGESESYEGCCVECLTKQVRLWKHKINFMEQGKSRRYFSHNSFRIKVHVKKHMNRGRWVNEWFNCSKFCLCRLKFEKHLPFLANACAVYSDAARSHAAATKTTKTRASK